MDEDVAAKIIISVEYANAVQKCKELAVGLGDITQARQKDIDTTQNSTITNNQNVDTLEREAAAAEQAARSIEKKAAAAKQSAKAIEKAAQTNKRVSGADVLGMSQDEYDRISKARAEASAKRIADYNTRWNERINIEPTLGDDGTNPENEAAIRAMEDRARLTRETKEQIKSLGEISSSTLQQEITDMRLAIAEKERYLAIQKQINIANEIKNARRDVNAAVKEGNPVKENESVQKVINLTNQLQKAEQAVLRAEQTVRDASARVTDVASIPEREAAIEDAKNELKLYGELSNYTIQAEIEKTEKLIAKKKYLSAIEKERIANAALNNAQNQLDNAFKNGNVAEQRRLQPEVKKLTDEYIKARQAALQSALQMRQANNNMQALAKTTDKSKRVFSKAAQGISRALRSVSRATGRSLGFDMSTSGMNGKGAQFLAGSMAFGAVVALAKKSWDLYTEGRTDKIATTRSNMDELRSTSDRMKEENAERMSNIETLRSLNQVEKLNDVQRLQQNEILLKLNKRLGNMSVEIDNTTGRIKNLGRLEEEVIKKDSEDRFGVLQQELIAAMNERARHENFLSNATAFTQVYDMQGIKEASDATKELNKRIQELQKEIGATNKILSPEATKKRWEKRNAEANVDVHNQNKSIRDANLNLMSINRSEKWIGREQEKNQHDRKYDEERLQFLTEKRKKTEKEIYKLRNEYMKAGFNGDLAAYNEGINRHKALNPVLLATIKEMAEIRERQVNRKRKEYAGQEAMNQSISNFMQREGFKYKDSSSAAVMANSMEGMQLQSRLLIQNTPQQKLLQQSQKQTILLEEIKRNLKRDSSGVSIQTQRV